VKARRRHLEVLTVLGLLMALAAIILSDRLSLVSPSLVSAAPAKPSGPPAANAGLRSTEVVTPTVTPIPQPGYRVYLPAVMKNATGASGSTSIELIDQALASGAINAETALVYKVYVMFQDTRLPGQYQGDDSRLSPHSSVMLDMAKKFPSLSKETQGLLAPFIMPPAYAGSWYDRVDMAGIRAGAEVPGPDPLVKTGWDTMGDQNVRVWFHSSSAIGAPAATTVANAMRDAVWPSLTGLMGRQPLSDQGPHPFVDLNGDRRNWGDGGDGRLDIYLLDEKVAGGGMTVAYPPGCKQRPAFILLSEYVDLAAAATHEFMHTILYSYDVAATCEKYDWLQEATATWSVDHVYPANNFEHRENFCCLFQRPELGLFYSSSGYSAYTFPFYLARKFNPQLMRTIWEKTRQYDSLEAVDKAVPGGLLERWPDFAVYLWNRAPFNDFNLWDKITEFAFGIGLQARPGWGISTDVVLPVDLKGAMDVEYKLPAEVGYLASNYYHFTFPDATARSVKFHNPFTAAVNPTAKVQALVKIEGKDWERQDWTASPFKTFCRDKKSERLEELVIIYSNSDWEPGATLDPVNDSKLAVTNIGCWLWESSAKTTTHWVGSTGEITTILEVDGLAFERNRPSDIPVVDGVGESYLTRAEGTVKWSRTGRDGDCTIQGGPITLPVKEGEGDLQISNYATKSDSPDYRLFDPHGVTEYVATVTYSCPGASVSLKANIGFWFVRDPLAGPLKVRPNGTVATDVVTLPDLGVTSEFRFEAQREP